VVDRAVSAIGRLEVMVNNAGVFTGLHTIVDETERAVRLHDGCEREGRVAGV
jgi:NAD(P)-dependent dehydrogenase (short-subunit alcohol dehydrogenase family)